MYEYPTMQNYNREFPERPVQSNPLLIKIRNFLPFLLKPLKLETHKLDLNVADFAADCQLKMPIS